MDNHTKAHSDILEQVELWWNGNITRLELIMRITTILITHESLEGGN